MDNRFGKYVNAGSEHRDYWHVYYAKSTDYGDTWSSPVRVSGTSDVTGSASIGGYGEQGHGQCIPPGDFLTCDADGSNLYVAWCDTRANQGTPSAPPRAYVSAIAH